ncbi:MAG: phosphoglucosamine mutase, partial [Clostridia bacterium]|nr:phosphoglucosamine mutase [Clostridia bacterium]
YRAFPQIALNVPAVDKTAAMRGVESLCEKLEKELSLRLVVRPSGTERVIRVMAEGESEENCALACKIISSKISENCGI